MDHLLFAHLLVTRPTPRCTVAGGHTHHTGRTTEQHNDGSDQDDDSDGLRERQRVKQAQNKRRRRQVGMFSFHFIFLLLLTHIFSQLKQLTTDGDLSHRMHTQWATEGPGKYTEGTDPIWIKIWTFWVKSLRSGWIKIWCLW